MVAGARRGRPAPVSVLSDHGAVDFRCLEEISVNPDALTQNGFDHFKPDPIALAGDWKRIAARRPTGNLMVCSRACAEVDGLTSHRSGWPSHGLGARRVVDAPCCEHHSFKNSFLKLARVGTTGLIVGCASSGCGQR